MQSIWEMLPEAGEREAPCSANICTRQKIYFPLSPERNKRWREKRKWQTADNLYFTPTDKMTVEKTCALWVSQETSHRICVPFSSVSVHSGRLCH